MTDILYRVETVDALRWSNWVIAALIPPVIVWALWLEHTADRRKMKREHRALARALRHHTSASTRERASTR